MDAWVRFHAGVNRVGPAQPGDKPYTEYPVLQGNSDWPLAIRNVLQQKKNIWNIRSPALLFGLLEGLNLPCIHMCSLSQQSTNCCCAVCFSLSAPPQPPPAARCEVGFFSTCSFCTGQCSPLWNGAASQLCRTHKPTTYCVFMSPLLTSDFALAINRWKWNKLFVLQLTFHQ